MRPEHKFDEISLDRYLTRHLHGYPDNTNENLIVRQYRYYAFGFKMFEYLQMYNNSKFKICNYCAASVV